MGRWEWDISAVSFIVDRSSFVVVVQNFCLWQNVARAARAPGYDEKQIREFFYPYSLL